MKNLEILIPELAFWNDGKGIDVESWISGIGQYDHAIGYSIIFWPLFELYDDCIFRHRIDADTYRGWMNMCQGDKSAVEAVVNHIHIMDLFVNSVFHPTKDVVLYIGSVLKDMWSCKLGKDFPTKRCKVLFPSKDAVELVDYQITFFQIREK